MKIILIEELCKGCGFCIEICPKGIFMESNKLNQKSYEIPKINSEISCSFCRQCELICPEMAIYIENEEK